jgi:sugar/nucleoside kinase (ribokinase family)
MQGPGVTCESDAMTDAWGNLHIDVVDDEIIVTLPLTSYTVTYYKPTNSPKLLAKRIANKNDPRVPVTLSDRTCLWQRTYETRIFDAHREVIGRGPTPEASQKAAERKWVTELQVEEK